MQIEAVENHMPEVIIVDEIGTAAHEHTSSLQRLLKDQRRLTKFIDENAG